MTSLRRRDALLKYTLPVLGLLIAYACATSIVSGDRTRLILLLGLFSAPPLLYVTLRWPLVFPFGLYAAFVPIDNILSISGGSTITKLVGIAAGGALLLRALILRRVLAPGSAWTAWTIVVVWMATTTLWSVNQPESLKVLGTVLSLWATYTITVTYPVERRELLVLAGVVVAVGVFLGFYAFYNYLHGQFAADDRLALGNGDYDIDPNHFAANFMLPVSVATMGFLAIRRRLVRLVLAASVSVMGLGILLTGSRGGLSAFAVLVIYVGIRTRRVREIGIVIAAALVSAIAFPLSFERFTDPTQGAASGRFYIWEVARPALLEQMRWIYGNGIGGFPTVYNRSLRLVYQHVLTGYDRPGHNLIVQSSVELGVIGLILVLVAWYRSFRSASIVPAGTPLFALRVASEGLALALFTTAMTIDILWFKYLWLALSIGPLVRNVYAPRRLFAKRSRGGDAPASASFTVVPTLDRSAATSSSSLASFE